MSSYSAPLQMRLHIRRLHHLGGCGHRGLAAMRMSRMWTRTVPESYLPSPIALWGVSQSRRRQVVSIARCGGCGRQGESSCVRHHCSEQRGRQGRTQLRRDGVCSNCKEKANSIYYYYYYRYYYCHYYLLPFASCKPRMSQND